MDNLELTQLLKTDPYTSRIFAGVFPCDFLPQNAVLQKPAAYIVNTDNSRQRGRHWILIILCSDKDAIFFDSYGLSPSAEIFPKEFLHFLKRNCETYSYQNKQLQDVDSSCCGHYCIFMLYHIARGMSYKKALHFFTDDFKRNDRTVEMFVTNSLTCVKTDGRPCCIYKQCCTPLYDE